MKKGKGDASVTAGFWFRQDARREFLVVPLTRQD